MPARTIRMQFSRHWRVSNRCSIVPMSMTVW